MCLYHGIIYVQRIPYITQYIRDQGFAARSSSPSFGSIAVAFSRSMAVRLVLDLAAVSILWVA